MLVKNTPKATSAAYRGHHSQNIHAKRTVDGVFRASGSTPKPVASTRRTAAVKPVAAKPSLPSVVRPAAHHTTPHKAQPATTLMRSSVKKPEPGLKTRIHVQTELQQAVPAMIAKKTSVHTVVPARLERSHQVRRSQHISKFSAGHAGAAVPVTLAHVTVQAPPKPPVAAPAPHQHNKPTDMFEQAIANASHFVDIKASHAHFRKKTRRHLASIAGGTLALLLLAGFATYQATPGLQLKVAGLQAGFTTNMPDFQAAGFAYTGVQSKAGTLTLGFSGNGGEYRLSQERTNWSDSDMLSNLASTDASGTPTYDVLTVGGQSVYRFSNTGATWIKHGVLYQLGGTQNLSDNQVQALVQGS